jgi:hypothetical protein
VDAEDHGNADVGGFEIGPSACCEGFDSGRRFLRITTRRTATV